MPCDSDQWRLNKFLKWGHTSGANRPKIVVVVVPLHFLALGVQLLVFVSDFLMVSTVYSVFFVCCSSTHDAPRAQPFVKWGHGHVTYGVGKTDSTKIAEVGSLLAECQIYVQCTFEHIRLVLVYDCICC